MILLLFVFIAYMKHHHVDGCMARVNDLELFVSFACDIFQRPKMYRVH
jgi:hypothetical protein